MKLGIDSVKDLLTALGPLITAGVLIMTVLISRAQHRSTVALEFHRRYDELLMAAHDLNEQLEVKRAKNAGYVLTDGDTQKAFNYYARFFSLQFDEYTSYRKGFVDQEVFTQWMVSRLRQAHSKSPVDDVGGIHYTEGWARQKGFFTGTKFTDFLSTVHISEDKAKRAIKEYGPRWWRPVG
jgi:hypothetical protein